MGSKAKAPPPPNYQPIADASIAAADRAYQASQNQLEWAKQQYYQDRQVSDSVIQDAMQRMADNDNTAKEDRYRYTQVFQPQENALVRDAELSGPNAAKDEAAAGKAMATVSGQFQQARQAAADRLESFGIDPSQVRSQAIDVTGRLQEAAARAAIGTQASTGQHERDLATQRALRSEAINVGRGMPGQVAASYGIALQSGNQAANTGLATTASGANTMGTPVQYLGAGNQALGNAGNLLSNMYSSQVNAYKTQASQSSGIGSVLGLAAGIGGKLLTGGAMPMAEGGEVPRVVAGPGLAARPAIDTGGMAHDGVPVTPDHSPSQGAVTDDVPARLNAGEFIVPRDAAYWLGEEKLQKMIQKARQQKAQAPAKPNYAISTAA